MGMRLVQVTWSHSEFTCKTKCRIEHKANCSIPSCSSARPPPGLQGQSCPQGSSPHQSLKILSWSNDMFLWEEEPLTVLQYTYSNYIQMFCSYCHSNKNGNIAQSRRKQHPQKSPIFLHIPELTNLVHWWVQVVATRNACLFVNNDQQSHHEH